MSALATHTGVGATADVCAAAGAGATADVCAAHRKPQRSCVACRQTADKRALVRFVRDGQGVVRVDATGRVAGRGAYLCVEAACFERARKIRALERALRLTLGEEDYQRLASDFEGTLASRPVEE